MCVLEEPNGQLERPTTEVQDPLNITAAPSIVRPQRFAYCAGIGVLSTSLKPRSQPRYPM